MQGKIAVFGDSIPKGIVTDGEKYEKLDAGVVSIIESEYGYEIENYSQYGQTLSRLDAKGTMERFGRGVDPALDNYAVISIGGNDADYDWKEVASSPRAEHKPKTPVDVFEKLLGKNVEMLKAHGVRVILTTIPPVDAGRYFSNVISKTCDGSRVLEFFEGDITNVYRGQEVYNYVILKAAGRFGCPVIDLRTGFLLDRNYLDNYCQDGIHPNAGAHRFMAEEVVRSLASQGVILKKQTN